MVTFRGRTFFVILLHKQCTKFCSSFLFCFATSVFALK